MKNPVLMVKVVDSSKFYLILSFNIRTLVYFQLEARLTKESNMNSKADIFVTHLFSSFVFFFKLFRILLQNNEALY